MNAGASSSSRPKRQLVKAACQSCQKRKVKCSGERPSCTLCQSRGQTCTYNSELGMTRVETVKRRNKELAELITDYDLVYHVLRNSSEHEAFSHLQCLREHPTIESYARVLRDGRPSKPPPRKRPSSTDGYMDDGAQSQLSPTSTQSQELHDGDSNSFSDHAGPSDSVQQPSSPVTMIDPQLSAQIRNPFAFQNVPPTTLWNLTDGWPTHDPTLASRNTFQSNIPNWSAEHYQGNPFQNYSSYDAGTANPNWNGVAWGPPAGQGPGQNNSKCED